MPAQYNPGLPEQRKPLAVGLPIAGFTASKRVFSAMLGLILDSLIG
jgi:hypothetical protein